MYVHTYTYTWVWLKPGWLTYGGFVVVVNHVFDTDQLYNSVIENDS